jgi:cytochrome b pre-mRNA-processing protein 3
MILSLFRNKPADDATYVLYRAVVAQSRQPVFYAHWGVPDTVTGRFDMISLHLALVFRRLRHDAQRTGRFSQRLFDLFFKDMDRSLRELGAGDLGVPKKIQKMGNLFYGLLASLDSALAQDDRAALAAMLARNIYSANPEADPLPLADYVLAEARRLAEWPVDQLLAGRLPDGVPS